RLAVGLLVVASLAPAVVIFLTEDPSATAFPLSGRELALNIWVRVAGTAVACVGLLAVPGRAAGGVTGAGERGTTEALLASPLEPRAILVGKWKGRVRAAGWVWAWLGLIWGVALLGGGLHPVALALLAAAWLGYAAVFAVLGLWCSVTSKT